MRPVWIATVALLLASPLRAESLIVGIDGKLFFEAAGPRYGAPGTDAVLVMDLADRRIRASPAACHYRTPSPGRPPTCKSRRMANWRWWPAAW